MIVHGAWNWAAHWLDVVDELADAHTCWVMDRRARARSGDTEPYGLDRELDDITAVLEAARPDTALLGHSSGATTHSRRGATVGRAAWRS